MRKFARPDLVGLHIKHNELSHRRMRKLLTEIGPVAHSSNPFFSIWREPEVTILRIVHENPGYRLLAWPLLGSLAVSNFLIAIGVQDLDDDGFFTGLFWGSLLTLGWVLELLQLYLGAWVLRFVGSRFGGVGSSSDLQVAIAWANVPVVCLVILQFTFWAPLALVAEGSSGDGPAQSAFLAMSGFLAAVELGVIAASVTFLVRGVAAIHRISWRRAVAVVLIAWLVALAFIALPFTVLSDVRAVLPVLFGPLAW